jgi:PEGA domain
MISIPSAKLIKWLQSSAYASVVVQNKNEVKALGKEYTLNKAGALEVGTSMLINLPKGYKVFYNGEFLGATPLFMEKLKTGDGLIRIESEAEYIEQKISVKKEITDTFTYEPVLIKHQGKLYINSEPIGANIFIDNKKIGKTPFIINKISIGEKKVVLELDGYFKSEEKVIVKKDDTVKLNVDLEKGYKVLFKNELPQDCLITITGGNNKENSYTKNENIILRAGKWKVAISGKTFERQTFEINISNKDEIIDFQPKLITAKMILKNLLPGSKVFLNGKDVTQNIKDQKIDVNIGLHKLKITTNNYEDFTTEVNIENNKDKEVAIKYNINTTNIANGVTAGGIVFNVGGVSCIIPGIVCLALGYKNDPNNPFNKDIFTNKTTGDSNVANGLYAAGGVLFGLGILLEAASIPMHVYAYRLREGYISFNFETGVKSKLYVSYNF